MTEYSRHRRTDRQTDRVGTYRHKQTHGERNLGRDRQKNRHREIEANRNAYIQTNRDRRTR